MTPITYIPEPVQGGYPSARVKTIKPHDSEVNMGSWLEQETKHAIAVEALALIESRVMIT